MTRRFRAPGRVNLMGDHTDYNEGFVLPMAIDRECVVTARPAEALSVQSLDLPQEQEALDRLVQTLVAVLGVEGVGGELTVESTVPPGAGLSSSAAVEVALALALLDRAGQTRDPTELAVLCQQAETLARGVPCGVMDQLTSIAGIEGHALLIDCRTLTVLPVPLPPDLAVLVVHSGVERSLDATPYGERRRQCETAAARLGLRSLRDATPDQVADDPVARHVVTENARTRAMAWALAADDRITMAELMADSHASLRDDFAVSTPELDDLVTTLNEAGAIGARLTGAGFGGCVVALVDRPDFPAVAAAADRPKWDVQASNGARPLP